MASELHVDAIKHSGGTSALTIDSSGNLTANANVHYSGGLVQIQTGTLTSNPNITATSFTDVGLSVSITPKFNTSKIFVITNSGSLCRKPDYVALRILRDSTAIHHDYYYNSTTDWMPVTLNSSTVDSPSSTSALTYKVQCHVSASASETALLYNYSGPGTTAYNATITVMEIAQ